MIRRRVRGQRVRRWPKTQMASSGSSNDEKEVAGGQEKGTAALHMGHSSRRASDNSVGCSGLVGNEVEIRAIVACANSTSAGGITGVAASTQRAHRDKDSDSSWLRVGRAAAADRMASLKERYTTGCGGDVVRKACKRRGVSSENGGTGRVGVAVGSYEKCGLEEHICCSCWN